MGRTLTTGAALGFFVLSACVVGIPAPAAGPDAGPERAADAGGCPLTEGEAVLALINGIRQEHGLGALRAEQRLAAAAIAHTADQAAHGASAVGHVGSDGSAPGDRVTAAGYDWRLVAENVAAGPVSARGVVSGWMSSPPHRSTILSPDAVHAGVGHLYRGDGTLNHFWTLVVAAPGRGADVRLLACHP